MCVIRICAIPLLSGYVYVCVSVYLQQMVLFCLFLSSIWLRVILHLDCSVNIDTWTVR